MSFEITGRLHKKFNTESRPSRMGEFKTREFVLEIGDTYPQLVKFQLVQDKCNILDNFAEEADITVSFELRGREWQGKYLTNLQCWNIKSGDQVAKPVAHVAQAPTAPVSKISPAPLPTSPKPPLPTPSNAPIRQDEDDLPF